MPEDAKVLDVDVVGVMGGSALTNFRPLRLIIAVVDGALRIVSSSGIDSEQIPCRPIAPGTSFADLFHDSADNRLACAEARRALDGEVRSFDLRSDVAGRIAVTLSPRFAEQGLSRGFFLALRDMRESDAARAEIDAAADQLTAILDNAADAIVLIGETGLIESANKAAESLFGWDEGELIGQPVARLMGEPYRSLHQSYMDRYRLTGRSGILNIGPRLLPGATRDGAPIAIELSIGEARIGGLTKFIGVCRDIGDRLARDEALRQANADLRANVAALQDAQDDLKRQQEQSLKLAQAADEARQAAERAHAAKSRLLATVSHELRTPLNGVLAVADLLATKDLADESRELVEIVRASGRDLVDLVSDILDLSKIEAGAMRIEAEPFSPRDLAASAAAVWSLAAKAKGLKLVTRVSKASDLLVGDAARLRQILGNLLSNAVKYTDRGTVTLSLNARPAGPNFMRLTFTVEDTGRGLDEALMKHLYEPFVRGTSEQTRRESGTGLGLAICRELIVLMGGSIIAGNAPSGGARLRVEIELPVAEDQAAASGAREPRATSLLAQRPQILVAEDHPVNRKIMGLLLEQLGADFEMVEDGLAAVEAVGRTHFDLVLMDMRMPRMDGLEATRVIRGAAGAAGMIPIIAVTADAGASQDRDIASAGVDAVLAKPITLQSLADAIASALATGADRRAPLSGAK